MIVITIPLVVNVLNEAKSDLGEVQLANHRIAHYDKLTPSRRLQLFIIPSLNVMFLLLIFALE
jgi:hypothetical protein